MTKRIGFTLTIIALAVAFALPANAQGFARIQKGPITDTVSGPSWGVDTQTGQAYFCNGPCLAGDITLGVFQGGASTSITTANFTALTGPTTTIQQGELNVLNRHFRIRGRGRYTTAAASLLNTDIALCTVSGCGSGTVFSPAGCVVTSTNQANVLANGQFRFECEFTVSATGATGTVMAKASSSFQLGAATTAALSEFQDTATAVSATFDLTLAYFVQPRFKFTTSNAGNAAAVDQVTFEGLN